MEIGFFGGGVENAKLALGAQNKGTDLVKHSLTIEAGGRWARQIFGSGARKFFQWCEKIFAVEKKFFGRGAADLLRK